MCRAIGARRPEHEGPANAETIELDHRPEFSRSVGQSTGLGCERVECRKGLVFLFVVCDFVFATE